MEEQIKSMTTKLYLPNAIDNIFNTNFLLSRLRKNQKSYDGGTSITQGIEYAELASGGSFSGLELLDTAINDVVTQAEYDWRHYYVTVGWLAESASLKKLVKFGEPLTGNTELTVLSLLECVETKRQALKWEDIVQTTNLN